jgi:2-polyprenyl-3-methyl-5-hydroxy-6-metoxy-1,4-benzoquinol methylase
MQLFLLLLIIISCTHHGDPNSANKHMHKASHHQLISNFEDPKRDSWQKPDLVIKLISPLKGLEVIDIGVGSGYFSKHLLDAGARVTGADIDEKFIEHCRKRFDVKLYPHFRTLKIGFDDPMMKNGFYDMAFTSNTYHHIENRVEYLKKVREGLKSSGRIVILDFKKSGDNKAHFGPPQDMRLPMELVVSELKQAGFDKISVNEDDFTDHYLVIATK